MDEKTDPLNTYEQITTYNNYYEFGTGKDDPARNSGKLVTKPWTVKVDGLVDKPGDYSLEDLIDFKNLEERIYRHRCVEAWSMVIPWIGVPLSSVLNKVQPKSTATFVEFTTLQRPSEMPGLAVSRHWNGPYVEGLRMDEAKHPLTLMVVGLYGKVLPNQNGAPLRVHIPWKYGFKSGKSIVRIRFTDKMPRTSWAYQNSAEYGFYANVNPTVDHPTVDPGARGAAAGILQEPADADVQRLRGSGRKHVRRNGPPEVLLIIDIDAERVGATQSFRRGDRQLALFQARGLCCLRDSAR